MTVLHIIAGMLIGGILQNVFGEFGWFCGYIIGLFSSVFLVDIFYYKNQPEGFFRRQRASILILIIQIVTAILAVKLIADNFLLFLAGLYAGTWIGQWLLSQLHWDESSETDTLHVKYNYLFFLYYLLKLSNTNHGNFAKEFRNTFNTVFEEEGYGDSVFNSILIDIQNYPNPLNKNDIPMILDSIPPELRITLLLDYLRCAYAAPNVAPEQKDMAKKICDRYNQFHEVLTFYERDNAASPGQMYSNALNVLGLNPGASKEEISTAYRNMIKQYHPDRLQNAGAEIQELAKQKTIEINNAYDFLTHNNMEQHDIVLTFLETESDNVFTPPNETFVCRCYLCHEKNRIPAHADTKHARCRICHAFLGLPE